MENDARNEIAELRKMISEYIAFLKEFTMKTLEVLRTIDRRLAALEARMMRGELSIPTKPAPKALEKLPVPKPSEAKPVMEAPAPAPVAKPKPKIVTPSPFKEKEKKKEEKSELPPDTMAKIAEAITEILDV